MGLLTKGQIETCWHDGVLHANLRHGSASNLSDVPRAPSITTYDAENAIELGPNHRPRTLTYEIVGGEASGSVRCTPYEMALPAVPKGTSCFAQQEGAAEGRGPAWSKK